MVKDNIWSSDIEDMQFISKDKKKRFQLLLCSTYIFSKYAWAVSLKDKKVICITKAFRKNLDEHYCNVNKIWVDKGSEFYINEIIVAR